MKISIIKNNREDQRKKFCSLSFLEVLHLVIKLHKTKDLETLFNL